MIRYLQVGAVVDSGSLHEVSVEDWLPGHDVCKLHVEVGLHLLLEQVLEPLPVLVVDQPVLEHPAALVVEQAQEVSQVLKHRDIVSITHLEMIS